MERGYHRSKEYSSRDNNNNRQYRPQEYQRRNNYSSNGSRYDEKPKSSYYRSRSRSYHKQQYRYREYSRDSRDRYNRPQRDSRFNNNGYHRSNRDSYYKNDQYNNHNNYSNNRYHNNNNDFKRYPQKDYNRDRGNRYPSYDRNKGRSSHNSDYYNRGNRGGSYQKYYNNSRDRNSKRREPKRLEKRHSNYSNSYKRSLSYKNNNNNGYKNSPQNYHNYHQKTKENTYLKEERRSSNYNNNNYQNNNNNNNHHNNHYNSSRNSKSNSKSSSSSCESSDNQSQSDSKDRSKDAGHLKFKEGLKYTSKNATYKTIKHLSDGTFGRVVEVKSNDNEYYAMKIIRAVPRYIDSAKTETEIIEKIQKVCEKSRDNNKIVKLHETFFINDKQNYAMVFEKLGPSIYDVIKKNRFKGFSMKIVQDIFRQTLEAIGFLHTQRLTHTDLKPENLLFKYSDLEKQYIGQGKHIYVPHYRTRNAIKVIDFGGATFSDEHHSSIINTRQYRAPEVIFQCCKWWEISDVWSIGCIILEILTGDLYFQTHENYEHVAMIEKTSGKIPEWMVKSSQQGEEWFTSSNQFNWPSKASSQESITRVNDMKTLDQLVNDDDLKDLLSQCLRIDPNDRIQCHIALKHSFFKKDFRY